MTKQKRKIEHNASAMIFALNIISQPPKISTAGLNTPFGGDSEETVSNATFAQISLFCARPEPSA
jgi:hypothetical protein